jgi:hypothetical protein
MGLRSVKDTPPPEDWTAIMPYPFCSSPAKPLTAMGFHETTKAVSCCIVCENKKRGAAGPMVGDDGEYYDKEALEKRAIKRWNKRLRFMNLNRLNYFI